MPIYLEIVGDDRKPKTPFKFNSTWIKDESYIQMTQRIRKPVLFILVVGLRCFFMQNAILET